MTTEEYLDPTDSVAVPRKTAARLATLDGRVITGPPRMIVPS